VIVDLAAEQGGNCELTKPGQEVVERGVTIIGYTDMASRMANVSSDLYGTNVQHLLEEMGGPEKFRIDLDNDIVRGALVLENGEMRWPAPPPKKVEPEVKESREGKLVVEEPPAKAPAKTHGHAVAPPSRTAGIVMSVIGAVAVVIWMILRLGSPHATVTPETVSLVQHLTVFVMAVFVGWQVVWNVAPALHTPLMSVTNAISGIIVVGGVISAKAAHVDASVAVALAATLFASINIAGGFLVTRRMLAMFRK
jgi:NAD(P) transhydrogenase subunit alpha